MSTTDQSGEPTIINRIPSVALRRFIAVGIALFLLSQILIPASYYVRGEPTSERFSWRMFSSIDLSTWETKVTVFVEKNGQLVERIEPIQASLQETYVKTVHRAQFDIVKPFMRRLAERDGVREVRFEAFGKFPSGEQMRPIRLSLTPGGEIRKLPN